MAVKITIVTATWNSAGTINDCLDSIAAQSWPNREHVLIDGASRDNTVQVLAARRAQIAVLVSEPDHGIYDALNKGIARSSGDVVGFLHADDVYAGSDVLARVAEAFADPAVGAAYGDLQYVRKDDTRQIVRHWKSNPFRSAQLRRGWMPPHPTLYVRREWYERIGGFDTRYRIAADYHSILRLFTQPGFKSIYVPKVFVKMRLGGASNGSLANIVRKSREDLDALRRTGVGGLRALAWKNIGKLGQFVSRG